MPRQPEGSLAKLPLRVFKTNVTIGETFGKSRRSQLKRPAPGKDETGRAPVSLVWGYSYIDDGTCSSPVVRRTSPRPVMASRGLRRPNRTLHSDRWFSNTKNSLLVRELRVFIVRVEIDLQFSSLPIRPPCLPLRIDSLTANHLFKGKKCVLSVWISWKNEGKRRCRNVHGRHYQHCEGARRECEGDDTWFLGHDDRRIHHPRERRRARQCLECRFHLLVEHPVRCTCSL